MIRIKDMSISYRDKLALDNVSLEIRDGKITGIIGPNGAGKSTFIKGVLGLVESTTNNIMFDNDKIDQIRKEIAYVEQRNQIDLTFPIKVKDVVLLGTYPRLGLFHSPKSKEYEEVKNCLKLVKMEEYADQQIAELSGGQLQRVFIARALAQDATIIFLDEPFVGIDMVSEKVIINILKKLKDNGKTIVVVHHDLHKVTEYFDDLIILNTKLVDYGSVESIFTTERIQAAYGDSMGSVQVRGVS
ncbi:metal ABC transporter ATP-binding protein [Breznakia pachnodae]|uniref:Iron/zinc/copper transport system ATP-binding protein n=1 Tax=Breznakia pachnodae TaxID=265178 RepID=A0ABU0E9B9_9FIRM|nr:metal ABC transporter ATP-binding protein [Breznakia pachnodae]MDQ0363319.1 iron/zinc/copper transport system ATP-binding protein [Breznakia pachnodae]